MQDIHVKLNPDCHSKTSIQQEEGCCHQQIGLKFKEENIKVLHLVHSVVWCWRRMEISWTHFVRNEKCCV